jgi:hypothetical protein
MASSQYADMFEYASFFVVMNTCKIEYNDVKLLKDMCDKKAGTKIEKIVLNPADGSWSIPKTKGARPAPVHVPKKKVEFKGVHTRFEDESDDMVYVPNIIPSSTFKVFQGRTRVRNISIEFDDFSKYIQELVGDDTIVVNHSKDLIRVAGIDLEAQFDLNNRYKLPFGNYSIVRIY